MLDAQVAYNKLIEIQKSYGIFHKTLFHVHTPASYDYKLYGNWEGGEYKTCEKSTMIDLCIKAGIITVDQTQFLIDANTSGFESCNELYAFLILAKAIDANKVNIVVVADHNTINGAEKLRISIDMLKKINKISSYPLVITGLEVSCADKNHVVIIFNKIENRAHFMEWLMDSIITNIDGSYHTSYEVITKALENNLFAYIAHINSSDIFKEGYLSGGYKRKLFQIPGMQLLGIADATKWESVKSRVAQYAPNNDFIQILDCDAHTIDELSHNPMWVKGSKLKEDMFFEALRDAAYSLESECPVKNNNYIKGVIVSPNRSNQTKNGFLRGKNGNPYALTFSPSLNCFIGGRGSGKSTVLQALEFVLSQRVSSERKLEFLAGHDSIWVLCEYQGDEYMVTMHFPYKKYRDDSILLFYGYPSLDIPYYKSQQIPIDVRDYTIDHYLEISKIIERTPSGDIIIESLYGDKRKKMLDKLFDTTYSVSELVQTASGNDIHNFILDTMFRNKKLSSGNSIVQCKKLIGLERLINDIEQVIKERSQQVHKVIDGFNLKERNCLRITYERMESSMKQYNFYDVFNCNKYYRNKLIQFDSVSWNISLGNAADYLSSCVEKLGFLKFLKLVLKNNWQTLLNSVSLSDFLSERTQSLIEDGTHFADEIYDHEKILDKICNKVVNKNNIDNLIDYLKKYITDSENFNLEFNLNNKESLTSDGTLFRSVRDLSMGQKVVAMLDFLLAFSDYSGDSRPLIIDQPEDNLDNRYIYKNLVAQLHNVKSKRQVIIATHNATLVTNAKAEQVIVMNSDNKNGWIEASGYLSEKSIKNHIVAQLEGGKESFRHKYAIYESVLEN